MHHLLDAAGALVDARDAAEARFGSLARNRMCGIRWGRRFEIP